MKNILLKSLLITSLLTVSSFAQLKGFGLGILVGQPTAISGKYWLSSGNALDFGLGYSFEKENRIHLHADYLFHAKNIFDTSENFSLYYGPGARLKIHENSDSRLGVRFDVGLVWYPKNTPIDVFLELAPILDIIPETDFAMNGGIGVRYFF